MQDRFKAGLVSIVLPTYNRAHLIEPTLDSVADQTYRPIELIIVDDGSTDATSTVVQDWADQHRAEDFRVHFFHQSNRGAPSARNLGLIESTGEFIQYLDSDDVLHPSKIEVHVRALMQDASVRYVSSPYAHFRDETEIGNRIARVDPSGAPVSMASGSPMPIFTSVWKALFRRSLCIEIGPWNETLDLWQDVEYNVRLAALRPPAIHVDTLLYFMRDHDGGARIKTLKQTSQGAEAMIHALQHIEHQLTRCPDDAVISTNLRGRYLQALHVALQSGSASQVSTLLDGLQRHSEGKKSSLLPTLLRFSYTFLGGVATETILSMYSDIRLGRA